MLGKMVGSLPDSVPVSHHLLRPYKLLVPRESSGGIARHILQQLETMSIVELDTKGGRRITSSGQRELDQFAGGIAAES